MFKKLASDITDLMEETNSIKCEDKAIYTYGIQQGLMILLNFLTTMILGCLFGKILQSIIFTALYMPLRRFAGGFHAKTPMRCYIYSTLMVVLVLLLSQYLEQHFWILITLSVFSMVAIALLSPVEDIHKPLDEAEQCVYRKKTICTLGIELLIIIFFALFGLVSLLSIASLDLLTVGILLILGLIKNGIERQNEN